MSVAERPDHWPEEVDCKAVSVDLAARGVFGNTFPVWRNLAELQASDYQGVVMLRYNQPGSSLNLDGVAATEIAAGVAQLVAQGADPTRITATVGGTCGTRLFQGEVRRSEEYLDLTYSTRPDLTMRPALLPSNGCQYASGLKAQLLLRHFLSPASYEDLQALWDHWPNATIEFTVFDRDVGDREHRNTVIWEVRGVY